MNGGKKRKILQMKKWVERTEEDDRNNNYNIIPNSILQIKCRVK